MPVRIQMQQPFNFKVVPVDDENASVPVSVAGQTMVDVQNILTDVGTSMVRQELRLQNPVPKELVRRFDLSMASSTSIPRISRDTPWVLPLQPPMNSTFFTILSSTSTRISWEQTPCGLKSMLYLLKINMYGILPVRIIPDLIRGGKSEVPVVESEKT